LTAAELGGAAIKSALARAGVAADLIEEVLMGCVLQAGQGQAPARQAALLAGLPFAAACTTIHKVCGSAMKATMLGHDGILAGAHGTVVVGGMESMSNAPYLLLKTRGGQRLGHGQVIDHMFMDGLEDAYSKATRGRLSARIVVTLLGALRKHGLRRGVASLCIGGGEATALAVETI
jgi:acetyl-CoA C-acetyltransferase